MHTDPRLKALNSYKKMFLQIYLRGQFNSERDIFDRVGINREVLDLWFQDKQFNTVYDLKGKTSVNEITDEINATYPDMTVSRAPSAEHVLTLMQEIKANPYTADDVAEKPDLADVVQHNKPVGKKLSLHGKSDDEIKDLFQNSKKYDHRNAAPRQAIFLMCSELHKNMSADDICKLLGEKMTVIYQWRASNKAFKQAHEIVKGNVTGNWRDIEYFKNAFAESNLEQTLIEKKHEKDSFQENQSTNERIIAGLARKYKETRGRRMPEDTAMRQALTLLALPLCDSITDLNNAFDITVPLHAWNNFVRGDFKFAYDEVVKGDHESWKKREVYARALRNLKLDKPEAILELAGIPQTTEISNDESKTIVDTVVSNTVNPPAFTTQASHEEVVPAETIVEQSGILVPAIMVTPPKISQVILEPAIGAAGATNIDNAPVKNAEPSAAPTSFADKVRPASGSIIVLPSALEIENTMAQRHLLVDHTREEWAALEKIRADNKHNKVNLFR